MEQLPNLNTDDASRELERIEGKPGPGDPLALELHPMYERDKMLLLMLELLFRGRTPVRKGLNSSQSQLTRRHFLTCSVPNLKCPLPAELKELHHSSLCLCNASGAARSQLCNGDGNHVLLLHVCDCTAEA